MDKYKVFKRKADSNDEWILITHRLFDTKYEGYKYIQDNFVFQVQFEFACELKKPHKDAEPVHCFH